MKFKAKHFKNMLVRFFTKDNYCVCEECNHIHKRDGKELRIDVEKAGLKLRANKLWYRSVNKECLHNMNRKIRRVISSNLAK